MVVKSRKSSKKSVRVRGGGLGCVGRGMWTLGERKPTICRPHLHLYIRHTALLMVFDKKHLPLWGVA